MNNADIVVAAVAGLVLLWFAAKAVIGKNREINHLSSRKGEW